MNKTGCRHLKCSLQTIFSQNKVNLCKIKSDNDLLSALDSNLSENEFNAQDTNFQIKLIQLSQTIFNKNEVNMIRKKTKKETLKE